MIYPILGLPGPLTSWCREVLAMLLEATGAKVDKSHLAGGLEEIGRKVLTIQADHLVFTVCRPDKDLAAVLSALQQPILSALSDPRRAALHLINSGGKLDPLTAVRTLSGDCSCLVTMNGQKHLVPLTFEDVQASPLSEIRRIAQIYGLSPSQGVLQEITERTAPIVDAMTEPENGGLNPQEILKETLDPGHTRAIEFLLGGLERQLKGRADAPLIATKELFLCGDPPHAPVSTSLDLTGRSRFIAFGPYIHIPPGMWMLRFVISFSEEAVGIPCVIDVGASDSLGYHELTRTHVVVSTSGRMDVTLAFQLDDPLAALQVRLMTEKPIFDGRLAVGFAEFRLKSERDNDDPALLLPTSA